MRLDDKNTVNIDGHAATIAPFAYNVSLNVNVADLAKFEPLLLPPAKEQQLTKAEMEAASSAKTPPPRRSTPPARLPRATTSSSPTP